MPRNKTLVQKAQFLSVTNVVSLFLAFRLCVCTYSFSQGSGTKRENEKYEYESKLSKLS